LCGGWLVRLGGCAGGGGGGGLEVKLQADASDEVPAGLPYRSTSTKVHRTTPPASTPSTPGDASAVASCTVPVRMQENVDSAGCTEVACTTTKGKPLMLLLPLLPTPTSSEPSGAGNRTRTTAWPALVGEKVMRYVPLLTYTTVAGGREPMFSTVTENIAASWLVPSSSPLARLATMVHCTSEPAL
jgi:hypothetical protein